MSRFNVGDRVRWHGYENDRRAQTLEILGVGAEAYFVRTLQGSEQVYPIEILDRHYRSVPVPFLHDGREYKLNLPLMRADGSCRQGVIRIDGQTGELSWAEGGPQ